MFDKIISFIKDSYPEVEGMIPLHAPCFSGKEKEYLLDCIDSTFVSSVGQYVDEFERNIAEFTGAKYAIATVNGTAALHVALFLAGIKPGDEVLTQAVSFVATANAITYCGAESVFLDSDKKSLGLSPVALEQFLVENSELKDDGFTYNKKTKRRISACVPMHVFGHPVDLDRIKGLLKKYNISLVEDAAESVGSFYKEKHTGTLGELGILSFNGNKIITTGGGGMILTDDESLGKLAKHITTTAKVPHKWKYFHDCRGYNYRMPNLNAALGCAQFKRLPEMLKAKRERAQAYKSFFDEIGIRFISKPEGCRSNYWLNAILFQNRQERDDFLNFSNTKGVMTRPLWELLSELPMYCNCQTDQLENARWFRDRLVNIPSSVRI